MSDVAPELLRDAFVAPIRFALLVDDEFPAYAALAAGSSDEIERAKASQVRSLMDLCRGRGWLCDVESDLEVIRNAGPHLHQSDLAIVDFHLDRAKAEDSTAAIGLLQRLATTPHFNLAVVYTRSDLSAAALDVAFALGAGRLPPPAVRAAGDTLLMRLEDEGEDVAPELGLLSAIAAGHMGDAIVLKTRERWKAALDAEPGPAIKAQFARYFEGRVTEAVRDARPANAVIDFDVRAAVPWVSTDNLFVAFVSKQDEDADVVERLCQALEAWNPPALKVLLVQARAELEKAGSKHDLGVLRSELRQAGWLYNVLSVDGEDRRKRIGELYGHLFEGMALRMQESVGEFGTRLLAPGDGEATIAAVRRWSRLAETDADSYVVHAANEFLSSTECDPAGRLTTGLVFSRTKNGNTQFWVCVTPSCDLVPGQNEAGWDSEMTPFKAVYAARLHPAPDGELAARIGQASNGRHIFLTIGGTPKAFEVAAEQSRQARLEVLFVANDGKIADGKFDGYLLRKDKDVPGFEPTNFKVVAQLRPGYANKFLMDAGMQKARIGLTWAVGLPPEAEPSEAAAVSPTDDAVGGA